MAAEDMNGEALGGGRWRPLEQERERSCLLPWETVMTAAPSTACCQDPQQLEVWGVGGKGAPWL